MSQSILLSKLQTSERTCLKIKERVVRKELPKAVLCFPHARSHSFHTHNSHSPISTINTPAHTVTKRESHWEGVHIRCSELVRKLLPCFPVCPVGHPWTSRAYCLGSSLSHQNENHRGLKALSTVVGQVEISITTVLTGQLKVTKL